jgi:hypothetical protein
VKCLEVRSTLHGGRIAGGAQRLFESIGLGDFKRFRLEVAMSTKL